MANPYLILWCDAALNKIYSGWQKNTQALTPILKQGDQIGCEIHWVQTGEYTATMREIPFPPAATIRLAVGLPDAAPLGGTFTITYGGDTTDTLAYDISAVNLQTALNGLASITAEGGVTVSKNGIQYRIVWNDAGVYTDALTSDIDMLYPTSESESIDARVGTATASRIVLFKLRQSVVAAQVSFTEIADPAITVESIFTNNWRVSIYPNPKEGVFSISFVVGPNTYTTISIPASADAFTVASALNAFAPINDESFTVLKSGDFRWDITSPNAVDSMSVTSGLIGFSAMYGVLDMNTAEVEGFLAGAESADAILEVEADIDGEIQTLAHTPVTIINDLIQTSSFTLVSMGEVMPVDSVVRYDTAQALTTPEQETARLNIDAVSLAEVSASLNLLNMPTDNEKAAMQNSVFPSSGNPFVTMTERNPFDQDLNTTDDVQFNTVTVGTASVVIDGTSVSISDATDTLLLEPTGITFPDSSVQTTAADAAAYLTKAGNLAGLNNTTTARTNLGLGSMALATSTDYLSKAGNLSGLASTSTSRTNLGLGTMAVATASDYLAKADNLAGLASTTTSRTNLGLGTMAVATASDYLAKADNLSGLASTSTSRTNIGLGTADTVTFNQVILGTSITFPDSTVQTTAATSGKQFVDYTAYDWQKTSVAGTSSTTEIGVGKSLTVDATSGTSSAWYGVELVNRLPMLPYAGTTYRLVMHNNTFLGLNSNAIEASFGMYKNSKTLTGVYLGYISNTVGDTTDIIYKNSSNVITTLTDPFPVLFDFDYGWYIEIRANGDVVVGDFGTYAGGYVVASDAKINESYPVSADDYYIGGFLNAGSYLGGPHTVRCGQIYALYG